MFIFFRKNPPHTVSSLMMSKSQTSCPVPWIKKHLRAQRRFWKSSTSHRRCSGFVQSHDVPVRSRVTQRPSSLHSSVRMAGSWDYMAIDLIHKSHNAPVPHPTMHHFLTEMCIFLLQNGALWDIFVIHCGICEMVLLSSLYFFILGSQNLIKSLAPRRYCCNFKSNILKLIIESNSLGIHCEISLRGMPQNLAYQLSLNIGSGNGLVPSGTNVDQLCGVIRPQ